VEENWSKISIDKLSSYRAVPIYIKVENRPFVPQNNRKKRAKVNLKKRYILEITIELCQRECNCVSIEQARACKACVRKVTSQSNSHFFSSSVTSIPLKTLVFVSYFDKINYYFSRILNYRFFGKKISILSI